MIKILKGVLLYFTAFTIVYLLAPLGILLAVINSVSLGKEGIDLGHYFTSLAVSLDQYGNVVMQVPFNLVFIKKEGHKFGDEDETISSVLGKNKLTNTLSKTGKLLDRILDFLDDNHTIKSIE